MLADEPREAGDLSLLASFGYTNGKNRPNVFKLGEGLVGQAALEKEQILFPDVPDDYIKVTSGLGESTPRFIAVTPILHEGRLRGVIELGTLGEMTEVQLRRRAGNARVGRRSAKRAEQIGTRHPNLATANKLSRWM